MECKSRDAGLGTHKTVEGCAAACAKRAGCEFFIFGVGVKRGRCYHEITPDETCEAGSALRGEARRTANRCLLA